MFLKGDTRRKYINARGPSPDLFKNTNFLDDTNFIQGRWYGTKHTKLQKLYGSVKAQK